MESFKKYIAEFIGTGVLVVGGCGTAVAVNAVSTSHGVLLPSSGTILAIALAFGLCIVAMAYSIGNVSGCHINPAVSLGMLINGKISAKDFVGYVIAQFLGATAGAAGLWLAFGSNASLGANGYGGKVGTMTVGAVGAGLIEVVITFIFVLAVLGVTSKVENSSVAGVVIALTLVLVHLIGIPFTGTSVNPARSFGPAILQGGMALRQLYVFIIAPLVGAVVAGLVHKFLIAKKEAK